MKKVGRVVVALVLALGVAIPAGTAFAVSTLPNGFTAKVVATSGQRISGNIDATGYDLGIYIGPGVHNVKVVGATVTGANDEGILVQDTSDIVIQGNTIQNNAVSPFGGGEVKGIVLAGTTNVLVRGNTVQSNLHGGISLIDDGSNSTLTFAPTPISDPRASSGNSIIGNIVKDNAGDCGIVVSAKNPGGGVSNNVISGNTVTGGVGGIVVAGGAFGTVNVTNNVVSNNIITGGFIPGISLHAFGPGVISGTQLTGNVLSHNGAGDVSGETTGIEIFAVSGVGQITGTQILRDSISYDYYGVFHIGDTDTDIAKLTTANVTVPVFP